MCTYEHHRAIVCDPVVWATLRFVGIQQPEGEEDIALELRDCPCGSTLSRPVVAIEIVVADDDDCEFCALRDDECTHCGECEGHGAVGVFNRNDPYATRPCSSCADDSDRYDSEPAVYGE